MYDPYGGYNTLIIIYKIVKIFIHFKLIKKLRNLSVEH